MGLKGRRGRGEIALAKKWIEMKRGTSGLGKTKWGRDISGWSVVNDGKRREGVVRGREGASR